jgi:hypothetical protein
MLLRLRFRSREHGAICLPVRVREKLILRSGSFSLIDLVQRRVSTMLGTFGIGSTPASQRLRTRHEGMANFSGQIDLAR